MDERRRDEVGESRDGRREGELEGVVAGEVVVSDRRRLTLVCCEWRTMYDWTSWVWWEVSKLDGNQSEDGRTLSGLWSWEFSMVKGIV